MQLFSTRRLFELVALNVVGPFSKPVQSYQYTLDTIDHYSKLAQSFLTSKTTSTQVQNVFVNPWRILYGKAAYFSTNNGT